MISGEVHLKPGRDRNIRARHPWVFSGAINSVKGRPQLGDTVIVRAANRDVVGVGAWSPHSQIQVRMWTFAEQTIDRDYFAQRIEAALLHRCALGILQPRCGYRLINAESDGLPGVVVDVYDGWLVIQCLTAGAEHWKDVIVDVLLEAVDCLGIYERSDVDVRKKEGLEVVRGCLRGGEPPARIEIVEEATRWYLVDVVEGHKTGFYLDQRDNRSLLQEYASGRSVLNCFSYTGGFAIAALKGQAEQVINIDTSQTALDIAAEAAVLNGFASDKMENVSGDVFKVLRSYRDAAKRFDLIVLDPPKFAENRNQLKRAASGYKDINLLAFKLLKPGGVLFTFSCSGLMDAALFQKIVADAAADAECDARIIKKLDQASDHPIRLAFPEGTYLKGLVCQK